MKNKKTVTIIIVVLIIFVIYTYSQKKGYQPGNYNSETSVQDAIQFVASKDYTNAESISVNENLSEYSNFELNNSLDAGDITIDSGQEAILTGTINYLGKEPTVTTDSNEDTLSYSIKSNDDKGDQNIFYLPLNTSSKINITAGAGVLNINLANLLVEKTNIILGTGQLALTLPQNQSIDVNIKSGYGDVVINAPSYIGVKIDFSGGSSVDLSDNQNFTKQGNGYISNNYNSSSVKADLNVINGYGNFFINTY